MREIVTWLKDHIRQDWNPWWYGLNALFLLVSFYCNYRWNLELRYLDSRYGDPWLPLYFLPYYLLPYFFTVLSYGAVFRKWDFLRSRKFWGRTLFILAVLSLNSGAYFHRAWIKTLVPLDLRYFAEMVMINFGSFFLFLIPIVLFKVVVDRHSGDGLYGFQRRNFHPRPYLFMLLIMVPLIAWASFQPDFLAVYPTYRSSGAAEAWLGVPRFVTNSIYEFFYLADFATVELLFRGFMVIGLSAVLGKRAVLPMVTTYAFLHFGKPLGEAIGSIFGGYILGVIALYGRNIWGGVIIHAGVAFLMDLAAIVQVYVLKTTALVHWFMPRHA